METIITNILGQDNWLLQRLNSLETPSFIQTCDFITRAKNKLIEKLSKQMNNTDSFKNSVQTTYNNLISFIKQNNSVQITYPGLDGRDHTIYITTDDIYYTPPDGQNISFFDSFKDDDERTKFQENYQKVFENMFGVPEEQIMLRF